MVRLPILRLAVALVFAAPAGVAGHALVHGVTRDAVPSEVWRVIFCLIGGKHGTILSFCFNAIPTPNRRPLRLETL